MNAERSPVDLAQAEAAYRAHLEAAAAGRAGDGRHGRKVFRAMLRALDALPARRLESDESLQLAPEQHDANVEETASQPLGRLQSPHESLQLAPEQHDAEAEGTTSQPPGRLQSPHAATTWVWSDLHLGHENIIRYTNRPFANASVMDDALYANWASTVGPADTLLFVGDVAMRKAVGEATWSRIRHAPGRTKQLVVGNHDLTGAGHLRVDGFDDVCCLLCADGDPPLLFTHMPLSDVPAGWVNVHGHTHAAPVTLSPHINVSVEHIRYRPLALARIRTLARALAQGRYPAGASTLERIESLEY